MRDTSVISYKMTTADAANHEGIIPVGRQFDFWGDAETEVMILNDGDESLCLGYDNVKFYEDIFVGDQIDFKATMVKIGNTSRSVKLETFKIATPLNRIKPDSAKESDMHYYEEPKLISEADVVLVVRKEVQRGVQPAGTIKEPWGDLE